MDLDPRICDRERLARLWKVEWKVWFPGGQDDPNLVLDTVKRAEDSDALVVRLYEAHGGRGTARLRVGVTFTDAVSCNLLEDPGEPLETDGDEVVLAYGPHEIVSVLVR